MERNRKLHLPGGIHPAALFVLAFLLASASELCYPLLPAQAAGAPSPVKQQSPPSEGASRANFVETAMDSLAGCAEDIFNLALTGNHERAEKRMDALKKT